VPGHRVKEIHFTLGSHLDLYWMGAPRDCLDRGAEIIGTALDLCEAHEEYRFYVESVVFTEHFLTARPGEKQRLGRLVREGRVEIGGSYVDRVEHFHGGESILRHHVYAVRWLQETLGVTPGSTCHADLPGLSPQVPQILAGCGIGQYLRARGVCGMYRWEAPDGSSILHASMGMGYGRMSREDVEELLCGTDRFPPVVLVRGGYGDLEMPDPGILDLVGELRASHPDLRFCISSPLAVVEHYRRHPAEKDGLPKIRGEWPFGWGNTGSVQVAGLQQNLVLENLLLTAEKITIAARLMGHPLRAPGDRAEWWSCLLRTKGEREAPIIPAGSELLEAWKPELFAQDHNYSGFSGPKSDHDRLVMMERAAVYAQGIVDNALSDLGVSFDGPGLPGRQTVPARLIVFNPLSWTRDDIVRVELPEGLATAATTGATVVDERGTAQEAEVDGGGVTLAVRGIPAFGCRPYHLVPPGAVDRAPRPHPASPCRDSWLEERDGDDRVTVESPHFRMVLSRVRGCFESIVSAELGREIALTDGPRCFGELVAYEDIGPDVRYRFTGVVTRDSTAAYELRRVRAGPLSATWAFEGRFNHARVEKLVTLYRDLPHLDLEIRITWWGQRDTHVRLCLPFASQGFAETWYGVPFHAVRWPTMMEGIDDAVILGMEANPDELAAGDRRHFREVVTWVDVGYGDSGVTVAVKLPNMWIDGNLLEIPLVRGNRSCGDPTVWPDNSGRRSWGFRLRPHEGDWKSAKAWRNGWEMNTPLVARASAAAGGPPSPSPMPSSFFLIGQDNIVVTSVKAADDGSADIILRYHEMEGTAVTVTIDCCRPVTEAHQTDLLEKPVGRLEIRGCRIMAPTRPHEIKTVRLRLA
jgi:alpha-mannosidase